MAVQPPDCRWICKDPECKKELYGYEGESSFPPKCPKCDGEMAGGPIVHRDPGPENPFKKY